MIFLALTLIYHVTALKQFSHSQILQGSTLHTKGGWGGFLLLIPQYGTLRKDKKQKITPLIFNKCLAVSYQSIQVKSCYDPGQFLNTFVMT